MKNGATDHLETNQSKYKGNDNAAANSYHPLKNSNYKGLTQYLESYLSDSDVGNLRLVSKTAYGLFTPTFTKRKLIQACKHADRARKEDVKSLCKILDHCKEKGGLEAVLKAKFNIMSPSMGLFGRNVTLYEWALGAATAVKNIIEDYFAKFDGGLDERDNQYNKYAPLIAKLFTQPAYDWSYLLREIKAAPADVVKALLKTPMLPKEDLAYESALYKAMRKFREDWAPGELDGDNPHMHDVMRTRDEKAEEFSVLKSLREADEILVKEWNTLLNASRETGDGDEYSRVRLVCRQVFGFMERRLTGEDRCNAAQGLRSRFVENKVLERTDAFTHNWDGGVANFADTPDDSCLSVSDLGGGFLVDMYYGGAGAYWVPCGPAIACFARLSLGNLMSSKNGNCAVHRPTQPRPGNQSAWCVMS